MPCKSCLSEDGRTFNAEIAIHFPRPEDLKKPMVWVFPKLLVCFELWLHRICNS